MDMICGDIWIYGYIYIYLGKFHHDRALFSLTIIKVSKGNDSQMAPRFRLVKYYNLPR